MFDLVLEKPSVESLLNLTMESGLGLDISKNSTGIAIFRNGVVETYQEIPEFDEDSDLRYYYLVKALEDDLLELVGGQHFDIIAIEDSIQGVNYKTDRMLILLNSVIDKLIGEGKVTCNYFRRVENTVWKKWLRTLRPVKKYETDKIEIENTFKYLDYSLTKEYGDLSDAKKKEMGYQDQLDSVGVLLGVGLERQNKGTVSKRKKQYKLHVELYESVEEIGKKYEIEDVTRISLSGDLNSSVKKFFKDLEESKRLDKFYIMTKSLGTLGVKHDISDLENKLNYVVLYQTER